MILITTLCFPILGFLLILLQALKNGKKEANKELKKWIVPLAFIFGMFGYSITFYPDTSIDLTRYFDMVDAMNNLSFRTIILLDNENLYAKDALFYFVNKTGNVHVLPFIVGFIIYLIVFYVIFDMIKRSEKKFKVYEIFMLAVITAGFVSPFSIIGNVRCVLSYVLISFAVYRELVQKKRNLLTLLLYILPLWLHSSAIIIIFIRIASTLLKKINKIAITIALLLPTLIEFAYNRIAAINFGKIGVIITNAIDKAYYYLNWTEGGWATEIESSVSNFLGKIFGTTFLIAILLMIIFSKSENIENSRKIRAINKPMIGYLYFVAIFALGCLSIKTGAFWRFEAIVVLFSPVIFIQLYDNTKRSKRIFTLLFLFSSLVITLNIAHTIRNLDAISTLFNYMFTPGIKVLYEIVKGILLFF